MSFLFSGYSALRGDKGVEQTGAETVHKLCDRVQNSTLLEDRRAAVLGLKGLSRDWKLEVGTRGMPVLIGVLRNDRMDVDIVKASMETLNILCSPDRDSAAESPQSAAQEENALELMFTEIFTKDASNVTLLLDVLEEVDFYVRFYTVQLLNTLLLHSGTRLQECILTSPLGVSRLIDLLDDRREIIRNEGLLLLIALTQNNADIQKIIAFENAFERLLGIIMDEGATDGGIIVQDCLQLTHNLLKYNVSNQNLFRETSCIQRIPSLLTVRTISNDRPTPIDLPLTDDSIQWSEQKITNANMVLELIRILAAPKNPSALVNQNVLNYAKIVSTLNELSFSMTLPTLVRVQALYAFGDAIRGHKANQDLVSRITLPSPGANPSPKHGKAAPGAPTPVVLQMIQVALHPGNFRVRAAAAYAFECYVHHNPDAQLAVLSTLIPPPSDNPNAENSDKPQSAGSLLVSAIIDWDTSRKEPFRSWFAATLLSHALNDNPQGQQLALATKVDEGEEAVSLLHKCMYSLLCASREGADPRVSIAILSLIAVWVHDCPEAVAELLTEGSNIQFLVEQINQSSGVNPLVQGVAAFLLGLLYEFNNDSDPTFTRSSLQSLVNSRIGIDVFASRIERLRESKELNTGGLGRHATGATDAPEVYFDGMFVELFKSSHDRVVKTITTVDRPGSPKRKAAAAGVEAAAAAAAAAAAVDEVAALKETCAAQETELETLRSRIEQLESQAAADADVWETETVGLRSYAEQKATECEELKSAVDQRDLEFQGREREMEEIRRNLEERVAQAEQELAEVRHSSAALENKAMEAETGETELAVLRSRVPLLESQLAEQTRLNEQASEAVGILQEELAALRVDHDAAVAAATPQAAQPPLELAGQGEAASMENEERDTELAVLRAQMPALSAQLHEQNQVHSQQIDYLQATIHALQRQLEESTEQYKTLNADHEDLLIYLAELDEEVQALRGGETPSHAVPEPEAVTTQQKQQQQQQAPPQQQQQSQEDAHPPPPPSHSSYSQQPNASFQDPPPTITTTTNGHSTHFPPPPPRTGFVVASGSSPRTATPPLHTPPPPPSLPSSYSLQPQQQPDHSSHSPYPAPSQQSSLYNAYDQSYTSSHPQPTADAGFYDRAFDGAGEGAGRGEGQGERDGYPENDTAALFKTASNVAFGDFL